MSARATILAIAVKIHAVGEASLRMPNIADRAGIAVALISHHGAGLVKARSVNRNCSAVDANREIADSIERAMALAQRVGFVRADLDARAIALFVQADAMGCVLAELDPNRPNDEALATVIDAVTAGLYTS